MKIAPKRRSGPVFHKKRVKVFNILASCKPFTFYLGGFQALWHLKSC